MSNDFDKIWLAAGYLTKSRSRDLSIADLSSGIGLQNQQIRDIFSRWSGADPELLLRCLKRGQNSNEKVTKVRSLKMTKSISDLPNNSLSNIHIDLLAVNRKQFDQENQHLYIEYGFYSTHFGRSLIGRKDGRICWVSFADQGDQHALHALENEWPNAELSMTPSTTGRLEHFFLPSDRGQETMQLPLFVAGTKFQIQVWNELLRIPVGQLVTYGGLARTIGKPNSARAVGNAVGSNPISYFIPCHRVVKSSGAIGGYRWSVERKQIILALECSHVAQKKKIRYFLNVKR